MAVTCSIPHSPSDSELQIGRCVLLGAVFWAALLFSCGGYPPQIAELRWRLNLDFTPREDNHLPSNDTAGYEALSVFIRPNDEDGLQDLDSMFLILREQDLFWALDSEQWHRSELGGMLWIGSNQFSSGYMRHLPRGRYTVELYDRAGEVAQRSFVFQGMDTSGLGAEVTVPPAADELLFLLPKNVPTYAIVGYNIQGDILFTDANDQSLISLKELKIRNDELEKVMLFFAFPNSNVFAQIGPYTVPRTGPNSGPIDTRIPLPEEIEGQTGS